MDNIFPRAERSGPPRKAIATKKTIGHQIGSYIKMIDIYGEKINLTYKGDDSFKTLPGASASIIIIVLLLAFSVFRMIVLFTKSDPNISKASFQYDLNS